MTVGAPRARWVGTPVFLAAAVVGGLAVAAAIEVVGRSPRLGIPAIAAVAVLLLSIQRLEAGLVVLVALTFSNGFIVVKDSADVPSAAFPFAALLLVFAVLDADRERPFLPRTAGPALAAFGAYGAWLVASSAWAEDPELALRAAGAYGKLMVMVLAVLALVRSERVLSLALWAIVGAAGALAAMTAVQLASPELTFFGFAKPPVTELTTTGEVTRAVGPVGNPNGYAQLLVIAVPLAVGRLLTERRLLLRLAAAAAAVLCIAAVYPTYSRGGAVGLAVVLALSFLRYRPRVGLLVVGAAAAALAVGLVTGSFGSRLGTVTQALPWEAGAESDDPSIRGRAAFLRAGLRMWRDHPLGGVGRANYPVAYPQYNRSIGADPGLGSTPHNTPLEVLSETGAIGLLLWSLLVLAAFRSLWLVRSRARDRPELRITADFLAISLAGYLVTALFLAGSSSRMVAWLLLALCFAARGAVESDARVRDEPRRPPPAR